MSKHRGIVAAGHEVTAGAAIEVIRAGGNAFDGALAALFASCVAEPVLASLGGGGFLMARSGDATPLLYDFFVQTPKQRPPLDSLDFYPIMADFGTAQQEFHIGMGSSATPGAIKGLFEIHRDLCRMPLREIIQPACEAARNGIRVNAFQHYISDIVSPIIYSSPQALALHESPLRPGEIAQENELLRNPEMADGFDILAREGEALFYRGEMGRMLTDACRERGGCLTPADLEAYRVERRAPLTLHYHDAHLYTNPPPSVGGILIAFTLALLEPEKLGKNTVNGGQHLRRVGRAMKLTQALRRSRDIDSDSGGVADPAILDPQLLERYRQAMAEHHSFSRGTTQISIADDEGNTASMTLSNGEGSGYVIPGCGIMMNNMLGEEDLNPGGFHRWPVDRRIASMMSPSLLTTGSGDIIVLGSGGSNRIRSAIMQVLINLVDFGMSIEQAVEQPRMHLEGDLMNIESGPADNVVRELREDFEKLHLWPGKNLFFGGAHTVKRGVDGTLSGCGDSRRGGVCRQLS